MCYTHFMLGAIIGDIAGSPYEMDKLGQDKLDYRPFFLNGLAKFTDDTNLTIATADAIMSKTPYYVKYLEWFKKNPHLGYGSSFVEWAEAGGQTVNDSWGNGAVMRISPIAFFANKRMQPPNANGDVYPQSIDEKLEWAYQEAVNSIKRTHNSDEARNGALAMTTALVLAGTRHPMYDPFTKKEILDWVSKLSGYDLTASLEDVRNTWTKRDCRCSITVPQAFICFRDSTDFESAIRNSVYSKGDVDTIAAMAGALAEYHYGVESINPGILVETKLRLSPEMIDIVNRCYDNKLKW